MKVISPCWIEMVHFRTIVQQHTNYHRHKSMLLFPEITAVKMVFKYKINLGQPLFCVDKTMFCNYVHHSKESVFVFKIKTVLTTEKSTQSTLPILTMIKKVNISAYLYNFPHLV